jgi:hypothetical protein
MKQVNNYTLKPVMSESEANEMMGTYADDSHYSILISEDCNAYKDNGEPLFFYRKNKIPPKVCSQAYEGLKKAATISENRGTAAGPTDYADGATGIDDAANNVKLSASRYRVVKQDGTLSKVTRAKKVRSGIAGYFDRNARFPYCRQTAYNEKHLDKFKKSVPMLKYISKLYEEACPTKYADHKAVVDDTHPDFVITDTVFTTVTVNKNFQTAYHKDAGDLECGLGNLAVLSAGSYEGGYTVMPRYDCAFDLSSGDVCFFDVHEVHGNTKMHSKKPFERISIVCYYRKNMMHCQSMQDELLRAKNRKEGDRIN